MGTPADSAELSLLGEALAEDVDRSIGQALAAGAVFPCGSDPQSIFQATLADSIRDIEHHERGLLLQRFLLEGPSGDGVELLEERLSDEETAAVTAFVFSFMVNSFKGALMELLTCAPCLQLIADLRKQGLLSGRERLFVGDSVLVATARADRVAKGADLHLLEVERRAQEIRRITVAGVAEVKSYGVSQRRLRRQLDRHLRRASLGLQIKGEEVPGERIGPSGCGPVRISVVPSSWKLPRTPEFEEIEGRQVLRVTAGEPHGDHRVIRVSPDEWRITLRWSREAVASAAFEMTFWYMEKVGEVIYRSGVPSDWSEMTPAEAGRNAVKMMLYYAILRARTAQEEERAIALYNTYGFGYALGMNFRRSRNGRREMLWPQDIAEVAEHGQTKHGLRFW